MVLQDALLTSKEVISITNTILFGKYEILTLLGAGSFCSVYLSKHLTLETYRAVKLVPKQPDLPSHLLSEAQILKSLHYPTIPILYDIEEDSDNYYLIEEYVEGEPLENFLLRNSNISPEIFYKICEELCNTFGYLHSLSPSPVLYLDLKPEHIIVCESGIKLLDFNVSTFLSNLGNICTFFGNEDFSAPELLQKGELSPSCDIYSLGKLIHWIAGFVEPPLSPNFHQIIFKATQKEPGLRYETVEAFGLALQTEFQKNQQPHLCMKIALFSGHPGAGCTHLACAMVSALNYAGFHAYYFEKDTHGNMRHLLECEPRAREHHGLFSCGYFKGYPNYGGGIFVPMPESGIFLYDYGDSTPEESLEVHRAFFVMGTAPWHRYQSLKHYEAILRRFGKPTILCNLGQKMDLLSLAGLFKQPVTRFPLWNSPFYSNPSISNFVCNLLKIKRRHSLFFPFKNLFSRKK